jgi:hypothetical protein
MKILHIIPELNKDGAERLLVDIGNEFQRRLDLRSEGEENFEALNKTKKRLSFGNAMFPLFLSFDR